MPPRNTFAGTRLKNIDNLVIYAKLIRLDAPSGDSKGVETASFKVGNNSCCESSPVAEYMVFYLLMRFLYSR